MPLEYRLTGVSRNFSTPEKSTISSNLRSISAFFITAVLNPPEIFILAIGALQERVVVRDGSFAAVPYSTFCLSFDHRGADGAPASRLLREIKHNLERYGEA